MINNIINITNIVNIVTDASCVQVKTQQGVPSQPSNLEAAEVPIPVISPSYSCHIPVISLSSPCHIPVLNIPVISPLTHDPRTLILILV